ncbi:uncharacterized protein [Engystomops pustulosus]|uniref:uncharacterized protein isoform X1 n=1 Tax=Engystomops pustulosus TaxID=76066 RepID=UPI003AFA7E73
MTKDGRRTPHEHFTSHDTTLPQSSVVRAHIRSCCAIGCVAEKHSVRSGRARHVCAASSIWPGSLNITASNMASAAYCNDIEEYMLEENIVLVTDKVSQPESEEEEKVDEGDREVPTTDRIHSAEIQELIEDLRFSIRSQYSANDFCFTNDPQWAPGEERPQDDMDIEGRMLNTDWCQCTNCSRMNSVPESICCIERDELRDPFSSEIDCITRTRTTDIYLIPNRHYYWKGSKCACQQILTLC